MNESDNKIAEFERALAQAGIQKMELRLFVAGMGPRSTRAIADLKRLCNEFLGEHCTVEIVDIYEQPEVAAAAQIVAVPTLMRERPLPQRKVIGEISNLGKIARSLGFMPRKREVSA